MKYVDVDIFVECSVYKFCGFHLLAITFHMLAIFVEFQPVDKSITVKIVSLVLLCVLVSTVYCLFV